MNVCLISNLYPPDVIGGAEIMVQHMARGLQAAGHEVSIITTAPRHRTGSEVLDGVRVQRLPTANLYWAGQARRKPTALKPLWHAIDLWNPVTYRRLRSVMERERFDVVHTHNLGGLSPAVWSAAARARIPIVHTPHDYALTCVRATRMTPAGRICARQCVGCAVRGAWLRRLSAVVTTVVAPTRFVLGRHRELGFFPHATAAVVPWAVPGPVTRPGGRTPSSAVDTPSPSAHADVRPAPVPVLPAAGARFLYLGQLRPHKGVPVILDAFARARHVPARLEIAGAGELAARCAAAAAADDRIRFHGFVDGPDKERLLSSSDVLLFPSVWWEVVGLVALEAFAHGVPVVGTRVGGIPELIEEGRTGFLIEPGDAAALADLIVKLCDDIELVRALRAECLAYARGLTIDRLVGRLIGVYENAAISSRLPFP